MTALRVVACAGILASACGPGFEAMHESDLRFEHCYRLDMDSRIAPPHREHCWRDWTETYAHDEPLDRIEYARHRIAELESGDGRLLSIHHASHAEGRVFEEVGATDPLAPMAAPAPTSAHEPPPKTAPVAAPISSNGTGTGMTNEPSSSTSNGSRPGADCAGQCDQGLGDCGRLCDAKQADCATCREDYRACMRRCYE